MSAQRALIFANGRLADLQLARALILEDDWLIAADGGARHLTNMGLMPHLLVGDLDSLSAREVSAFEKAGVRIERHPVEKDETDLELAVSAVLAQGYRFIRIIGALGGRIDQALGNLCLLSRLDLLGVDIRLDDGVDEVFLIRERVEVAGNSGDGISLLTFGLPVQGIYTEGLRYPLRGETLSPGQTRGISNLMLSATASIKHNGGELVCIHTRKSHKQISEV